MLVSSIVSIFVKSGLALGSAQVNIIHRCYCILDPLLGCKGNTFLGLPFKRIARHQANWLRMSLPTRSDYLAESFSYREVQLKNFCPPVKTCWKQQWNSLLREIRWCTSLKPINLFLLGPHYSISYSSCVVWIPSKIFPKKTHTCPTGKWRTEYTGLRAKSTSCGLWGMASFACCICERLESCLSSEIMGCSCNCGQEQGQVAATHFWPCLHLEERT